MTVDFSFNVQFTVTGNWCDTTSDIFKIEMGIIEVVAKNNQFSEYSRWQTSPHGVKLHICIPGARYTQSRRLERAVGSMYMNVQLFFFQGCHISCFGEVR